MGEVDGGEEVVVGAFLAAIGKDLATRTIKRLFGGEMLSQLAEMESFTQPGRFRWGKWGLGKGRQARVGD